MFSFISSNSFFISFSFIFFLYKKQRRSIYVYVIPFLKKGNEYKKDFVDMFWRKKNTYHLLKDMFLWFTETLSIKNFQAENIVNITQAGKVSSIASIVFLM